MLQHQSKDIRYLSVLLLLLCFLSNCNAQKQDYVWMIGIDQSLDPGIQGMTMNWNGDSLFVSQSTLANGVWAQKASICDEQGKLLFWSNGCSVMNREQEVMPHGDTLNWDTYRTIIPGRDTCIRGYPKNQSTVILSDPNNTNGFYLFHKAQVYRGIVPGSNITSELRHSYIDMTLDGGLGDIVYFDSTLYDGHVVSSSLEAIQHANGVNWWVLNPVIDDSIYLTYFVDSTGIHRMPDQIAGLVFSFNRAGAGTARFSPDGTLYAFYDYFLNVHLYDFDRQNGLISNHRKIHVFDSEQLPDDQFKFGSVEWSSNSRFLYVTNRDSLIQIDTWEPELHDGIRLIDTWDGTLNPFATTFYLMSLGPDCKIYMCSTSGNKSYHVIKYPNKLGTACEFVQNGLQLPQNAGSANLPLHPRFRVDENEKCDPSLSSVFGHQVYYRRDLEAFPNPTSGSIQITIPNNVGNALLEIYDLNGRQLHQEIVPDYTNIIMLDLSSFASAPYHIELYPMKNPKRIYYGMQIIKK